MDSFSQKMVRLENELLALKQFQQTSIAVFPVISKTIQVPITYIQTDNDDEIWQWSYPTVELSAADVLIASAYMVEAPNILNSLVFEPTLKNGHLAFKIWATDFKEPGHYDQEKFIKNHPIVICSTSDFTPIITQEND